MRVHAESQRISSCFPCFTRFPRFIFFVCDLEFSAGPTSATILFNSDMVYCANHHRQEKRDPRKALCISHVWGGLSLSIDAALLTPRGAHEPEPEPAGHQRVFFSRVASRRLWFPRQAHHSTSRQIFEDDDALHPQRCRTCHCVRPSRNHAPVPISVHYAPNPYDSNTPHTCVRVRLENFFEPDNVPR